MTEQPDQRRRASIYDVAKRAGVSHMTVSRVINDQPNIRPATRQRVMTAISELGYLPSSAGRALARSPTMRLGVIVNGPNEYGPNSTVLSIERAARARGYTLLVHSRADSDEALEAEAALELAGLGAEAICVIGPGQATLEGHGLRDIGMPVTVTAMPGSGAYYNAAFIDQEKGVALAIAHLVGLGHRRIAHISGSIATVEASLRERAWRSGVSAFDPSPVVLNGDWSSEFGYHVGQHREMLGEATAVFCANDQMALGLVHGLATRGVRIPADVSVVGFDDRPESKHFMPPLTTVSQDFDHLGSAIVDVTLRAIEGEPDTELVRLLPELVVRESTAPPRAEASTTRDSAI